MARQITTTVYPYDELSDAAQAKAREWLRELRDSTDLEHVIEDADRMVAILGFAIDRRTVPLMNGSTRQDPAIYWSLGYSQSDGVWIEASYSYANGSAKAIRAEAPQDADLHAIADGLQALQAQYGYQLTARIDDDSRWSRITLSHPTRDVDNEPETFQTFQQIVRDLERWIYQQLRAEDEYQNADEQIADTIRANEYEFTEDGRRA